MNQYLLTRRAEEGLFRIILYVESRFGSASAGEVLDRLEEAFQRLADHPSAGHTREDLSREAAVLFWSVGPALIAYRERKRSVEILFVERGERDWSKLLPVRGWKGE